MRGGGRARAGGGDRGRCVAVPDLAGELSDATRSLGGWIYLAVMALVFLETTALLGFMIHGELALMLGGVAAERGDATLPAMIALVCAAAVAGDMVSLTLGRRLGRPFLERRGGRIGLGPARLARVDGFFARHGGKALFLGRFTGFLRATMPFVAGSSGLTARRLLPYSAASALVWTATFTVLGYAFSESFIGAGETATRVGLVGHPARHHGPHRPVAVDGTRTRDARRFRIRPQAVTEQGERGGRHEEPDQRDVDEHGGGEPDARHLDHRVRVGGEAEEHGDHDAAGGGDDLARAGRGGGDRGAVVGVAVPLLTDAGEQEHVVVRRQPEQDREHEQRHVRHDRLLLDAEQPRRPSRSGTRARRRRRRRRSRPG